MYEIFNEFQICNLLPYELGLRIDLQRRHYFWQMFQNALHQHSVHNCNKLIDSIDQYFNSSDRNVHLQLPLSHFQRNITVFAQIDFVAHNGQHNIWSQHFLQFFHPIFDLLKGILIGYVIHQNCTIRWTIINWAQCMESVEEKHWLDNIYRRSQIFCSILLLPGGVPNRYPHCFAIHIDFFV